MTLMTDTTVLEPKDKFGSVDFWFPSLSLGIAADGEQHFPQKEQQVRRGNGSDGCPRRAQWQVDDAFNNEALRQGLSLLRVKFSEEEACIRAHVLKAIRDRMEGSSGTRPFIRFTPGFGKEDM